MMNLLDPASWPAGPTRFCLYGGPGAGKSTAFGDLYGALKRAGRDAEVVPERIKEWAYLGRRPTSAERARFFNEGYEDELAYSVLGVDVVTDSPLWLDCFYIAQDRHPFLPEFEAVARRMDSLFQTLHVFFPRRFPYRAGGRYQSEAEALAVDGHMKDYLRANGVPFIEGFAQQGVV